MRLCTTSQPQLYPPLYLISRFRRADIVVWLTQAQYQSGQFMSDLQLQSGKRRVGVKMDLIKEGRPLIRDVKVDNVGFEHRLIAELRKCYAGSPFLEEAIQVVQDTFHLSFDFVDSVVKTTENLLLMAGSKVETSLDYTLVPDRPENASQWLSDISLAVQATGYFQGEVAMMSYLDHDKFSVPLYSQIYETDVDPKLSILHYVATLGWDKTVELCSGDLTILKEFK